MKSQNKIIRLAKSSFKMRLFMLMKLPFGFLAGLRITEITSQKASVSITYKYLTKNPFRSVYFAALSMAAELSTGILALAAVEETKQPISMLVLEMKASFKKKATGKIIFTCNDAEKISSTVNKCLESNEGQTVTVKSTGVDKDGNDVAEFEFTWTFKMRT